MIITRRAILAILTTFAARPAWAHSWYSSYCCNGKDCAPIPPEKVRAVAGGFAVVLNPGDHPQVTEHQQFFIPYRDVILSQDDQYHICLYPTQHDMRCFYAPANGV